MLMKFKTWLENDEECEEWREESEFGAAGMGRPPHAAHQVLERLDELERKVDFLMKTVKPEERPMRFVS